MVCYLIVPLWVDLEVYWRGLTLNDFLGENWKKNDIFRSHQRIISSMHRWKEDGMLPNYGHWGGLENRKIYVSNNDCDVSYLIFFLVKMEKTQRLRNFLEAVSAISYWSKHRRRIVLSPNYVPLGGLEANWIRVTLTYFLCQNGENVKVSVWKVKITGRYLHLISFFMGQHAMPRGVHSMKGILSIVIVIKCNHPNHML